MIRIKMIFEISDKKIENVITKMENDWVFEKINNEKRRYQIYLLIWIIILSLIALFLYINWVKLSVIIVLYILFNLFLFWIISYFFSNKIKSEFLVRYIKELDERINFSVDKKYFPMSLDEFYSKSWILNSYEMIDKEEDSISIETDSFNLYWEEILTSRRVSDSKWRKRKETTNRAYIIYITIKEHRFPIKESVKLLPDAMDRTLIKILYSLWFWFSIWALFTAFLNFIFELFHLKELFHNYFIYFFLFWFSIWIILYFYLKWLNRIKLENKEFEKFFDVYSENDIEARRLLTPKLMEKLVEFVKNSKFRWLAFNFIWNEIYIKFNVRKFLEVSLFWDMKEQIYKFLYQIKLIIDFIN